MSEIIEEWRDIKGYEGKYQVSNIGRVKSIKFGKELIMKLTERGNGYLKVTLCKYGICKLFQVHQLVAQAFLGHVIDGFTMIVNHIDGNNKNNKVDNLNLKSQRENLTTCIRKDFNKFTSKYPNVHWSKHYNKWISSIRYNGKLYSFGYFIYEEDAYNKSKIALSHIINCTFEEYIKEKE